MECISRGIDTGLFDYGTFIDRFLYRSYHELNAEVLDELVSEGHGFWKVVTRIDVNEWERNLRWEKSLAGQVGHDDAVFTTRKEDGWIIELGKDLTNDVDRFRL
ncbi:MAG: Uncharacterised protein [Cryomorphaceae bacterium]|nr:MAG: Uncharacterised protein [Cryomorphaceae bacterium]